MTFKVNIENGTSFYTTDEIISYGLSGCLYAGDTDLTAFVEQIVTQYEDKLEQASGSRYIDDVDNLLPQHHQYNVIRLLVQAYLHIV